MKYVNVALIGLSMFLGFGTLLSAADKQKNQDNDVIKITVKDNDKTIKAATGKKIEIQLKGNPTTGFEWRMAELKSEVLKSDGKIRQGDRQVRVSSLLGKRQSPGREVQREHYSGRKMKNRLSFVDNYRIPIFPLSLFPSLHDSLNARTSRSGNHVPANRTHSRSPDQRS
jgi:hypothetical protein